MNWFGVSGDGSLPQPERMARAMRTERHFMGGSSSGYSARQKT
jgi:hypothetical protein